jgi:hypothetical protein
MVTRLLRYAVDLSGNETDLEVDSKSPGSGKRFAVQEIYVDSEDDVDYSLVYEERKLFDNVADTALADENNGIPFDVIVGESEDLAVSVARTARSWPQRPREQPPQPRSSSGSTRQRPERPQHGLSPHELPAVRGQTFSRVSRPAGARGIPRGLGRRDRGPGRGPVRKTGRLRDRGLDHVDQLRDRG